jgi:hypothetical protein
MRTRTLELTGMPLNTTDPATYKLKRRADFSVPDSVASLFETADKRHAKSTYRGTHVRAAAPACRTVVCTSTVQRDVNKCKGALIIGYLDK